MAGQALPLVVLLFASISAFTFANPDEGAALLRFRSMLPGSNIALPSWIPNSSPCVVNHTTWDGVICVNGRVWGVRLEGRGLNGRLDLGPLIDLLHLRTLSFMHNELVGPLPDLRRFGALKAAYFSDNKFYGQIPDAAFAGMRSLKKVFLSSNQFSGPIPTTLAGLPKLLDVRLDHNKFSGQIPDFRQTRLEKVDVSFNNLDGAIPASLSDMNSSLFQGNDGLCGMPLSVVCEKNHRSRNSLFGGIIAFICSAFIGLPLFLVVIFVVRHKQERVAMSHPSSNEMGATCEEARKLEEGLMTTSIRDINPVVTSGARGTKASIENVHERLMFIQEGTNQFDLNDLLSAPAKVMTLMGRNNLSDTYKAFLPNGPTLLVKGFIEMNDVGREFFEEHMKRIGRLSHSNILPLVAYLYGEEEKLLVTNLVDYESLDILLHGKRGSLQPPLDWPTRLKIVKGVTRGLAYLYDELPMLILPHGHLKSSSILLNRSLDPLLTEYALAPLINAVAASQFMAAYKSPEASKHGRLSKKSDIWSLGILIMEILTGACPENFLHRGSNGGTDLAAWVRCALQEEWRNEVFDAGMKGGWEGQGEMLRLLHVGLDCCQEEPGRRPDVREVLLRIEQIKETTV